MRSVVNKQSLFLSEWPARDDASLSLCDCIRPPKRYYGGGRKEIVRLDPTSLRRRRRVRSQERGDELNKHRELEAEGLFWQKGISWSLLKYDNDMHNNRVQKSRFMFIN